LKAVVKSSDPDGDFIYYAYQWEKNGLIMPEEKGEVFEKERLKKGDSITITVTPDDRGSLGKQKKSDPITILNSPPIIVSSPPSDLKQNIYTYQMKAVDLDNDPMIFVLKKAPKGMVINRETGLIQWEVSKGNQGDHSIEIEATDPEGAKSFQRYTLTIEVR
jgi:hypothetical protein